MAPLFSLKGLAIATGLIDLGERIYHTFFDDDDKPVKKCSHKSRNIYDTSKFTKSDFDLIVGEHKNYLDAKAIGVSGTTVDLAKRLNQMLSKNKSRGSYAKVWNGHIKRDDLEG